MGRAPIRARLEHSPWRELKAPRNKKLLRILKDLDGELQLLGVRCDWGWLEEIWFLAETLEACFCYLARLPGAPPDMLIKSSLHLIDNQIGTELRAGHPPRALSMFQLIEADKKNAEVFARLLDEYRRVFSLTEEEQEARPTLPDA